MYIVTSMAQKKATKITQNRMFQFFLRSLGTGEESQRDGVSNSSAKSGEELFAVLHAGTIEWALIALG